MKNNTAFIISMVAISISLISIFLNGSNDKGRFELYRQGIIRLDKQTGEIWINKGGFGKYKKMEIED